MRVKIVSGHLPFVLMGVLAEGERRLSKHREALHLSAESVCRFSRALGRGKRKVSVGRYIDQT